MVPTSLVKTCAILLCAEKPCVQRGLQCSTAKCCICSKQNYMENNRNYHSFHLYVKNGSSVTGAAGTDPQLGRPVSDFWSSLY